MALQKEQSSSKLGAATLNASYGYGTTGLIIAKFETAGTKTVQAPL